MAKCVYDMSSVPVENISLEADSELRFEVETPDTKVFVEVIKFGL